MTGTVRTAEALGLIAPFALWALAFSVLYGGHGLACGIGMQPADYASVTRIVLGLILVTFIAAHAWLAWRSWRRWKGGGEPALRFVRLASFALALAALATTLWTGFPVLVLRICS